MRTDYEQTTSGPAVPWDGLLSPEHKFTVPPKEDVVRAFRTAHEISEALYEGNGIWRDSDVEVPLVRWTSRRVLGYISACRALGDAIYRKRAEEGLGQLLREQKPSGTIVWYNRSLRGIDSRDDGMYETGIAGNAFIEGYRLLGDKDLLRASERAARWAMDCPISWNNNYNMFAVWHLAAHYAETGGSEFLESAIHKTREGGFTNQFASGGWPGHNSWIWYHGIIIRGMAELYNALPEGHSFRKELYPRLVAAINRVIREQEASGAVPANPGCADDRHRMCFALHGLLIARDAFGGELDNCIHGLEWSRIRTQSSSDDVQAFEKARTDWESRRAEEQKSVRNELVWRSDFEEFGTDPEWGEMAEGWENCWYPMNDPIPRHIQWRRNALDQRTGDSCQEYRTEGGKAFSGIGFRLPKGLLTIGDSYRFDVWAQCRKSKGAKGAIRLLYVSAYSGEERPLWDCMSGCEIRNEEPSFDGWEKLSVRFRASGETNFVYIWMQADPVPEGEKASMLIDSAELYHEGKPLTRWKSPLKYDDWECDILVSGLYLERMFRRESTKL